MLNKKRILLSIVFSSIVGALVGGWGDHLGAPMWLIFPSAVGLGFLTAFVMQDHLKD